MRAQQPDYAAGRRRTLSTRVFLALIVAGVVLRAAALPLPGTGDVMIWKTWTYNAVTAGETTLYGVGRHPPERRTLAFGSHRFAVDYPPLALYELGLAGRLYNAVAGAMSDTAAFTVAVKLPSVFAEIGLAVLIYFAARRMVGGDGARLAALAWWLNPTALLNASALGYLDPLFALPAVAALIAAASGSTWLAGVLLAVSVMTKAQGLLVAPVIVMAVITSTDARPAAGRMKRPFGLLTLRLGETAAGAVAMSLVVLTPYALGGSLPNLVAAVSKLAQQDMLSGNAANLWWIATWVLRARDLVAGAGLWHAVTTLPRILAISSVMDLGYPNPRLIGLAMMGGAWAWALWQARRARDLPLLAGVGAFLVHAYFVLSAQVHENHLFLAIPLAVMATVGRRGWAGIAVALTAIQALNLNLFYGLSEGIHLDLALPRGLTLVDAAVLLSAANCAALFWHARVLRRESALFAPVIGADHQAVGPSSAANPRLKRDPAGTILRACRALSAERRGGNMASLAPVTRVVLAATWLASGGVWVSGCSAAARLEVKCVAGDVAICTQLGDMYATGKGVARDTVRAAQAYERACNGGAVDVCNTLGEIMERTGSAEIGVPRSEQLFQKACEGGSSPGCLNLGLAAAEREDKARAFALYERSCSGGWAAGCHQLAATYEQGEGVAKDVAKAVALYAEACDGEHVESCTVAGDLYLAGEVVTKDIVTATRFYGKALQIDDESCQAGNQADCTERDRLRTRVVAMSMGQAAAAPPMPAPAIK
ncbi:MAG TPA: hypothetical protein VF332_02725 [Vicinamibacterales bacterium]